MFRVYSLLTFAAGSQRRFIRRIAALCLLFMGVHLCADHLDDVVYTILDSIDLFVDQTGEGVLSWLAQHGGMSAEAAMRRSEAFATWIDLAEKDRLALWIALLVELVLDLFLIDLAWGRHVDEDSSGFFAELRASGRQMIDALSPLDLERLVVIPTLFLFTLGGAALAALAVESMVRDIVSRVAPDFLWGSNVAATIGILTASLLVWRFAPDLLHGALLRSHQRHTAARERALDRLNKNLKARWPKLDKLLILVRLATRGWWLCAVALPIAITGLLGHNLIAIIERAVPTP